MSVWKQHSKQVVVFVIALFLFNFLAQQQYWRFDLTTEQRYSISDASKQLMEELDDVVYVKVYLEGEFPAGFVRVQNGVKDMLNELKAYAGSNLEFVFIDPTDAADEEEQRALYTELMEMGINPTSLKVQGKDGFEERILFPGAVISYKGRELGLSLLENQFGLNQEEVLNNSIILLEYKIASTIQKLDRSYRPKVAFLEGHGELNRNQVGDLSRQLVGLNYEVGRFDIRSSYKIPDNLDVVVVAKPQQPFSEQDKFKLDQYIMHGGKVLWLVDGMMAEMDSLRNENQMFMSLGRDLNLDDQLFKYGVRINNDLLQDLAMCNPIPLVVGSMGDAPQTQLFPWPYYPIMGGNQGHPITKNLTPVMTRFVSTIDTVRNGIDKTILLQSSDYSKRLLSPVRVHLGGVKEKQDPKRYNKQGLPTAVLLEGEFTSVFDQRITRGFQAVLDSIGVEFKPRSGKNAMIVVADGDVARNDIQNNGSVMPLGMYYYMQQTFANSTFLLNAIEYLLDDSGLISTRTKEIQIRLLDRLRIQEEKLWWQLLNVAAPMVVMLVFGLGFYFWRRKQFAG